jgi:hypothetical protein
MATTARPNATAVPTTDAVSEPQLSDTAVPQPRSVRTIVPTISARYFFIVFNVFRIKKYG